MKLEYYTLEMDQEECICAKCKPSADILCCCRRWWNNCWPRYNVEWSFRLLTGTF